MWKFNKKQINFCESLIHHEQININFATQHEMHSSSSMLVVHSKSLQSSLLSAQVCNKKNVNSFPSTNIMFFSLNTLFLSLQLGIFHFKGINNALKKEPVISHRKRLFIHIIFIFKYIKGVKHIKRAQHQSALCSHSHSHSLPSRHRHHHFNWCLLLRKSDGIWKVSRPSNGIVMEQFNNLSSKLASVNDIFMQIKARDALKNNGKWKFHDLDVCLEWWWWE